MKNRGKIGRIAHKNVLGFTLIELLVVIAIIGVLATVSIVGFSSAKSKSRDAKTLSDMNALKKAISLYSQNQEPLSYPAPTTWVRLFGSVFGEGLGRYTNLAALQPPKNDANSYYFYAYSASAPVGYWIGATIENGNDALKTDNDENNAAIQAWADGIIGINGLGAAIAVGVPNCQDTGNPPTRGVWCLRVDN